LKIIKPIGWRYFREGFQKIWYKFKNSFLWQGQYHSGRMWYWIMYTWHILYEWTHMVGLKVMFEFVPIIKRRISDIWDIGG
jgi:hypothetical protein